LWIAWRGCFWEECGSGLFFPFFPEISVSPPFILLKTPVLTTSKFKKFPVWTQVSSDSFQGFFMSSVFSISNACFLRCVLIECWITAFMNAPPWDFFDNNHGLFLTMWTSGKIHSHQSLQPFQGCLPGFFFLLKGDANKLPWSWPCQLPSLNETYAGRFCCISIA